MRLISSIRHYFILRTAISTTSKACMSLKVIPTRHLGVSEPDPSHFGNPPNEKTNSNWTNKNWLISRFHFSFAEYSNPKNTNFGVLRVMNDDLVQPLRGFGGHPHSNVEICTYIVEGELTHKDSMGTQESLARGSIQFMTAGTGVSHSEHNRSAKDALRFIQIWITTRERGLKPNYGSMIGDAPGRENKWAHLVSDVLSTVTTPIKINQDANIYVTEIFDGNSTEFILPAGRQAYLLCMEGTAAVSIGSKEGVLEKHYSAELIGPLTLRTSPVKDAASAHMLLVEMESDGSSGRSDVE